jgi:hypothetical protein
MAFPFSIEGSLVVDIDAAAKASRVMDGVERWLVAQQARDLRRVGDRLEFRGNPAYTTTIGRLRENPKASIWRTPGLREVTSGTIRFRNHPERVEIDFALSSSPLQAGEVLVWLIFGMLLARVSALLALAVVMAVAPLITYVSWRMTQYTGRSELRHAAIRGLADGAARELVDLQARSHSRI